MKPIWLVISVFVVFLYLVVVNGFLFPLVFPDGLAEKFVNAHPEKLLQFHLLAFAATAFFLTVLVDKLAGQTRCLIDGATAGVLLGLLVALPEHLHLFAMVDATAITQFIPVLWITVTWGLVGLLVGFIRSQAIKINE